VVGEEALGSLSLVIKLIHRPENTLDEKIGKIIVRDLFAGMAD
jgi:hypothetical protein